MGTGAVAVGSGQAPVHSGPESSPQFPGAVPVYTQTQATPQAPPVSGFALTGVGAVSTLDLGLRFLSLVLATVSLSIIASIRSGGVSALDYRCFQFIVAASAMVLAYEAVLIGLSFLGALATPGVWTVVFVADQILAYLMFSASSVSGYTASVFRSGDGPNAVGVCYGSFSNNCSKVEAGTAMGFVAFPALAVLAVMSGLKVAKIM